MNIEKEKQMQKAARFSGGPNTSAVLLRHAHLALAVETDIPDICPSPPDYLLSNCDGHFFKIATLSGNTDISPIQDTDWDEYFRRPEDDFGRDLDNMFNFIERTPPTEDSWVGITPKEMPTSRGVEYLRWMMEGVKASEIASMDAQWVAIKYTVFVASIIGGIFSEEIFDDASLIIGRYSAELEGRLCSFGIEHKLLGGITDAGYQRLKEITA